MNAASTLGLYVTAETIARAPDHARALVEERGVGVFVIRTGFDPGKPAPYLDEAVSVVTRLGVRFQFLVGTWWGDGMSAPGRTMEPAASLSDHDPQLAHEAQWRMVAPGSGHDEHVRASIAVLCDRHRPSGICLTHARYRHAADINGLFATADGPFGVAMAEAGFTPARLAAMLGRLGQRLQGLSPATAAGTTLIGFLDTITESDDFSRWFDFRCRQVTAAVGEILAPGRQRHPGIRFGTNAMGPLFSRLCGQDYRQLATVCDFIQPLFGYMRWHVLQPIYAWAVWLHEKSGTLDPQAALILSARLFGFDSAELDLHWEHRNRTGEGAESSVIAMVRRQLDALHDPPSSLICPVLRGQDLAPPTTESLIDLLRGRGFQTIFFQGTDNLPLRPQREGQSLHSTPAPEPLA